MCCLHVSSLFWLFSVSYLKEKVSDLNCQCGTVFRLKFCTTFELESAIAIGCVCQPVQVMSTVLPMWVIKAGESQLRLRSKLESEY